MKNNKFINQIIKGDIKKEIQLIEDKSVDVIITDPPYFLDKLDNNWDNEKVNSKANQQVVKSLPAGMKFDPKQGREFYKWFYNLSEEFYRVLKPGGFFFSFSSPRLYHRLVSAVDDNGFLIKDGFAWIYLKNQPKAMSLNHFIDKMDIDDEEKEKLKNKLKGWKTPQIKSCFEPIMMAQKPYEKTYLDNMIKNNVGLFNTEVKVGNNKFPANLLIVEHINEIMDNYFLIDKPNSKEKGKFNNHLTVKPKELIKHLIRLSTFDEESVVFDPFMGSGTTAVAAIEENRKYIGIEISQEYIEIAKKRIDEIRSKQELPLFS
ncbi:MAG: site-specific DNA-methyltransferase [candidate division WOR-3 bacterium]|nr:site-specific DNA-methyltransferase [candidate division WOR-3 bacterium]